MNLVKQMLMLLAVVLISAVPAANAQQSFVELTEPGPISVPEGKTYVLNEVRKAILSAAMRNDWRVASDAPGIARIVLDERADGAELTLDIVYSNTGYSLKYVSSKNLRYDPNGGANVPSGLSPGLSPGLTGAYNAPANRKPTIHPSYARWLKNLTNAINIELLIVKL